MEPQQPARDAGRPFLRDPRDENREQYNPLFSGPEKDKPVVPEKDPDERHPEEIDPQPPAPPFRAPTDEDIGDKGKAKL